MVPKPGHGGGLAADSQMVPEPGHGEGGWQLTLRWSPSLDMVGGGLAADYSTKG